MRTAPALTRALFGVLLALLLALRLLSPAGFMPAFDGGAVTIVACPDEGASAVPASSMHHHHDNRKHQPCPYAAGSSISALGADFIALIGVLILGAALLLGRSFLFLERNNLRQRPPTRGPPIPA